MPADTTESVAEHGARLQPPINLHAPVTAFMFSCSGTVCVWGGGGVNEAWTCENLGIWFEASCSGQNAGMYQGDLTSTNDLNVSHFYQEPLFDRLIASGTSVCSLAKASHY